MGTNQHITPKGDLWQVKGARNEISTNVSSLYYSL